jgi:hypothetical protein
MNKLIQVLKMLRMFIDKKVVFCLHTSQNTYSYDFPRAVLKTAIDVQ